MSEPITRAICVVTGGAKQDARELLTVGLSVWEDDVHVARVWGDAAQAEGVVIQRNLKGAK